MLIVAKSGPISSRCPFGPDGKPISARESELIRGNEHLAHPSLASSRTCCRRVCVCMCVCVGVCVCSGAGGGWLELHSHSCFFTRKFICSSLFIYFPCTLKYPSFHENGCEIYERAREKEGGRERERERERENLRFINGLSDGGRESGETQTGRQREKDL